MSACQPDRSLRDVARGIGRGSALLVGLSFFPAALSAQAAASAPEMHHRHGDPMAYVASLDDPARDAYQKPDEVLKALALRPGEVVADLGAGSGYFALRFAKAVGETGRVYAVDVSPDMIRHLNRRLRDAGVRNVVSVLSDADDPLLPDASVDRFVIVNTWHHIEDQQSTGVAVAALAGPFAAPVAAGPATGMAAGAAAPAAPAAPVARVVPAATPGSSIPAALSPAAARAAARAGRPVATPSAPADANRPATFDELARQRIEATKK